MSLRVSGTVANDIFTILPLDTNGTMQNRFLNLDNFFICLAYDDLMVGISDGTNCF